mmetsp:Transcript_1797/g.7098  ORF Transcript_1797/g.7098 Transcript_1797/m.7098 type:complete len:238 (+) Transcript_1797:335-1048(+)
MASAMHVSEGCWLKRQDTRGPGQKLRPKKFRLRADLSKVYAASPTQQHTSATPFARVLMSNVAGAAGGGPRLPEPGRPLGRQRPGSKWKRTPPMSRSKGGPGPVEGLSDLAPRGSRHLSGSKWKRTPPMSCSCTAPRPEGRGRTPTSIKPRASSYVARSCTNASCASAPRPWGATSGWQPLARSRYKDWSHFSKLRPSSESTVAMACSMALFPAPSSSNNTHSLSEALAAMANARAH